MKKLTILLFGAVCFALITGYIGSVSADHDDGSGGIFHSMDEVSFQQSFVGKAHGNVLESFSCGWTNFEPEFCSESKYKIHLQTVIRNGDGHLINVNESTSTMYIPHKKTDEIFDQVFPKKEIVTVDDIKYEKAQFSYTPDLEQRYISLYPIYSELNARLQIEFSAESVTKMHEENKIHTNWKLHYCNDFGEEHGMQCVAVFFCLVPTITLEPSDTVTQQWTILRAMD